MHVCVHEVKMTVLLSDHKVIFVFAGAVTAQGSDGEMRRDLYSEKASNPICGPWAPAGRSAVVLGPCTGESVLYCDSPPCSMADLCAALILWSCQHPCWIWWQSGWSMFLRRFFFFFPPNTPNDSLVWGLSTGQARLNLIWQCRKFTSKH